MQDKIQEIMGLVLNVACAGIDYGRATQTADGGALKRLHDAEKEVETKLRVLVREQEEKIRVAVARYSLASEIIEVRSKERAHGITNASN